MSGEWAAAFAAAAAVCAAVYWRLRIRLVLPLERALRSERARSAGIDRFARELCESVRGARTPELLSDSLRFAADRFLGRFGGLHLFVWRRMEMGGAFRSEKAELVCRTGFLAASEPQDLEVSPDLWFQAAESLRRGDWPDGSPKAIGGADVPAAMRERFQALGLRSMRLLPWGTPGKIWGLIGALDPGADGPALKAHADALRLLAAYAGSAADLSSRLWEEGRAREKLEGGLDLTQKRLDETNLRLIQRAKDMKSLQEVSEAISEHAGELDALAAVASTVAKAMEADVCAFLLVDETTGELVVQPGAYGLSDAEAHFRVSLQNEMSSSVRVFLTGQSFSTGDAQNDPRVIARYARLWRCNSLLILPLRIESRRIGLLQAGSFRKNFFQEGHLQFASVIAEEAAVLVESAMLARRMADMNRQMARLHTLKDDFISTVSHEFKTPLTTIQGFLSVVLDEEAGSLTHDQRRFLASCKRSSERLVQLVGSLLDISKLESGEVLHWSQVSLEEAARQSADGRRWEAERRGISLEFSAPSDLPRVEGDSKWLLQVFDNLLSNALKFTPDGGRISVSVENKGDCLRACVRDSGPGVPEEDRGRLFDKFFRGQNSSRLNVPGTGLGLAICRSIVEKHQGKIGFESEPGRGACFFFLIPVSGRDKGGKHGMQ